VSASAVEHTSVRWYPGVFAHGIGDIGQE